MSQFKAGDRVDHCSGVNNELVEYVCVQGGHEFVKLSNQNRLFLAMDCTLRMEEPAATHLAVAQQILSAFTQCVEGIRSMPASGPGRDDALPSALHAMDEVIGKMAELRDALEAGK